MKSMKPIVLSLSLLFLSCDRVFEPYRPSEGWFLQSVQNDGITYHAITFADENDGWLVGHSGTIKHTNNGGDSWRLQQSHVSSDLWDVFFKDNKIGWACGSDDTILRTLDGGASWERITLPQEGNKTYVAIQFANETIGWTSNNQSEILKTIDGGRSWEVQTTHRVGGARLCVIDENVVYYLAGQMYRSFDGGITWDSLETEIPNTYRPTDMFFTDSDNGYIVVENGTGGAIITDYPVFITQDGGHTWQPSEWLEDEGFRCVHFMDEQTGWVAGNENIYKTTDGGDHWQLEYSSQSLRAKDIHFIDARSGWIVNWNGDIFKYQNGTQ